MPEAEQVVEQLELPVDKPAEVATPEKVDEGAAPAIQPSAKVYTQEEVDAIAARVERRTERKKDREWREELEGRQRQTAQPKVEAPVDLAAPKREDFEDYGDFIRAEARHVARMEVRAEREAEKSATEKAKVAEDHATAEREFHKRMQAAEAKYPDFEDVMAVAVKLPISDVMYGAIIRLEEAPDLVHYFGTHPEEAHRIALLHPTVQATEIGKLAAKLPPPAPKPASVSKAPEPIEPIGGKVSQVSDQAPNDPEEFKRWHDARERAKAQARRRA